MGGSGDLLFSSSLRNVFGDDCFYFRKAKKKKKRVPPPLHPRSFQFGKQSGS
jgi:hypothetical protein